jgi:hypothetical protein
MVAAAIAVAGTVTGSSLAAASSRTASSGTEHIYLMSTQRTASKFEVVASGVFTAAGTDISGTTTDTVKLPGGTFKANHGGPPHIIKQQVNTKTCFFLFEASGKVTLNRGTGKYKGISGSGKALITDLGIFARNSKGACNPNANPVASEETITATATVKL